MKEQGLLIVIIIEEGGDHVQDLLLLLHALAAKVLEQAFHPGGEGHFFKADIVAYRGIKNNAAITQ